jgi:D-tagatose-1,6-bisphosphate aldolase subunit GatZ/KbaZ
MAEILRRIVEANRAGGGAMIPSVCTAQAEVLRACLTAARRRERPLVIEATSNQVNHQGGYTGMTPAAFLAFARALVAEAGVDPAQVAYGGDHLGPQAWRRLPAPAAMAEAEHMVAAYAAAGFTKLHLDCSEGCAGEPAQLADAVTAARSARLAAVARAAAPDPGALVFVIGTEVPPPGGARLDEGGEIAATTPHAARATLAAHEAAFAAAGQGAAFAQVAGLVVQPGVEFSPTHVHPLPAGRDPGLRAVMMDRPGLALEAHSTDYQEAGVYPRLAALGFAFQKVGPALTFAWREALYALDALRAQAGLARGPSLPETMERLMCADPGPWAGHYRGEAAALRLARHWGLADRIRYYWPQAEAVAAVAGLMADLDGADLPDAALLAHFRPQEVALARASGESLPRALARARVETALAPYFPGTDPRP